MDLQKKGRPTPEEVGNVTTGQSSNHPKGNLNLEKTVVKGGGAMTFTGDITIEGGNCINWINRKNGNIQLIFRLRDGGEFTLTLENRLFKEILSLYAQTEEANSVQNRQVISVNAVEAGSIKSGIFFDIDEQPMKISVNVPGEGEKGYIFEISNKKDSLCLTLNEKQAQEIADRCLKITQLHKITSEITKETTV